VSSFNFVIVDEIEESLGEVFVRSSKKWTMPIRNWNLALSVFLVSFIAMVITTFHNFVLPNGLAVIRDTFSLVFSAIIFLAAVGFWLYSRAMQKRSVIN
jgi:hypothetical protein